MNTREKAIRELQQKIREQKARIDPALLKKAEAAARTAQQDDLVPYDKESAVRAVELFLQDHADAAGFEKRLADLIRRSRH